MTAGILAWAILPDQLSSLNTRTYEGDLHVDESHPGIRVDGVLDRHCKSGDRR